MPKGFATGGRSDHYCRHPRLQLQRLIQSSGNRIHHRQHHARRCSLGLFPGTERPRSHHGTGRAEERIRRRRQHAHHRRHQRHRPSRLPGRPGQNRHAGPQPHRCNQHQRPLGPGRSRQPDGASGFHRQRLERHRQPAESQDCPRHDQPGQRDDNRIRLCPSRLDPSCLGTRPHRPGVRFQEEHALRRFDARWNRVCHSACQHDEDRQRPGHGNLRRRHPPARYGRNGAGSQMAT